MYISQRHKIHPLLTIHCKYYDTKSSFFQ